MLRHIIHFLPFIIFFDDLSAESYNEAKCLKDHDFDYIVVGSGSTGGALASRLSETPNVRVLLLEAGKTPTPESDIPYMLYKTINSEMDWNFTSTSQKYCCHFAENSELPLTRGKALGGTSSLNFMTYTRGFKEDYDRWAELGNDGWSWNDVFPYLLKLEDYKPEIPDPEDAPYHHKGGPITVEFPSFRTPLAKTFLDAGVELGHPLIDYNARGQTGFMYPPVNTRNGTRCGTYLGYILPAMNRINFVVETEAFVTKILINENNVATGVRYDKGDNICVAKARREVIVSAGAFGSPHLLLLSGIGPKDDLRKLGIEPLVNSPGVGQNYHDHVSLTAIGYFLNDTVAYNRDRYETPDYLEEWQQNRTGPMTSPIGIEGLAFITSDFAESTTWPDIEIYFLTDVTIRFYNPASAKVFNLLNIGNYNDVISIVPIFLRPRSRGYLTLRSNNPYDPPLMDPQLLSHPKDRATLMQAMEFIEKMIGTEAFQRYNPLPITRNMFHLTKLFLDPDRYLIPVVTAISSSGFHPAGTCKMGPSSDRMAVVNNELKVRGVQRLRVADASIMPEIVAGHPNVACIMIGEKLADMIKQEWGDPVRPFAEPDLLASA